MQGISTLKENEMAHPEDCSLAYSFKSPEELRSYYNGISSYYNLFLESTNYVLHRNVAEVFTAQWQDVVGAVLDVACGTGKLGLEVKLRLPKVTLDGLDFSSSMIAEAETWGVYNAFHNINLKGDLSLVSQKYDVIISSGAFTPGHLNADDLINLRALMLNGGRAFISVKKDLFEEDNFAVKLQEAEEDGLINSLVFTEVLIWDNPSFTDTAIIVTFQKTE
jgi:SAM-dependent methyltransferase